MKEFIEIIGITEIIVERKNGKIEREVKRNTIHSDFKKLLANHLADDTVPAGLTSANFFTTNAASGGAEDGNDGIVISDGNNGYTMITTLYAGGAGSNSYATFKGVYTASGNYTATNLYLGRDLDWVDDSEPFDTGARIATQTLTKALENGDKITIKWTITFA